MPTFALDAKVFCTVHVDAPTESAARAALDDAIGMIEGNWRFETGATVSINSASQDGDADLTEVDGVAQ